MENYQKLIDEYTEDYCLFLEATYSDSMLSEGGTQAVEHMFQGIEVKQKSMLDIGFGLGGADFYLAKQHGASVTGIELNPWLVQEATRRTPEALKEYVKFVAYDNPPHLPFNDNAFEIVFSKGVLVHVNDKLPLFVEMARVCQTGGQLVIDDWLSPTKGQWGERLQKMCEMEDLTLYAETVDNYSQILKQAGFTDITIRDENKHYVQYNEDIVAHLKDKDYAKTFIEQFDEKTWHDAIEAYQLIADSIRDNELLIRNVCATR